MSGEPRPIAITDDELAAILEASPEESLDRANRPGSPGAAALVGRFGGRRSMVATPAARVTAAVSVYSVQIGKHLSKKHPPTASLGKHT